MPNKIEIGVYREKQLWRPLHGRTIDCEGSNEDFFRVRDLDYYSEESYGLKS